MVDRTLHHYIQLPHGFWRHHILPSARYQDDGSRALTSRWDRFPTSTSPLLWIPLDMLTVTNFLSAFIPRWVKRWKILKLVDKGIINHLSGEFLVIKILIYVTLDFLHFQSRRDGQSLRWVLPLLMAVGVLIFFRWGFYFGACQLKYLPISNLSIRLKFQFFQRLIQLPWNEDRALWRLLLSLTIISYYVSIYLPLLTIYSLRLFLSILSRCETAREDASEASRPPKLR